MYVNMQSKIINKQKHNIKLIYYERINIKNYRLLNRGTSKKH